MMKSFIAAGLLAACFLSSFASAKEEKVKINLGTEGDNIAFSPSVVKVKFSKNVAIEFVNNAGKDSGILHNIVIYDGKIEPFLEYLQKVQYDLGQITNYKGVLGVTKGIEPGDTEVLKLKLEKPGEYHYVCTMPGHGDILGMRGKIIFE